MASKKEQKNSRDNPLKNLKWEKFCQLFVQKNDDNTYNNATRSYAFAYDYDLESFSDDDAVWEDKKNPENGLTYRTKVKKSTREAKEHVCAVEGRRLLRSPDIQKRIQELFLIRFHDDDYADNELQKVIEQDKNPTAKVSGLKLRADLKGRIISMTALTDSKGNDILPDQESLSKSLSAIAKVLSKKK